MSFSPETPELGFASRAVRAGQVRTQEGEHAEPIFLTSSFVFADAAEAANDTAVSDAPNAEQAA